MAFRFEQLEVWREAIEYTKSVYLVTKTFPRDELFALTDQLRRSSSSVPANIAEGSGSSSNKDFCHYLDIAIKSTYETISHFHLAKELGYISETKRLVFYEQSDKLVRKMQSFKRYLQK